jgi:MFS superfamily sulfate permease-like transporter
MGNISEFQPGIRNNLKYDLPAGLVVFLVALPLCLGIALASGAPLFAGLISGIIGGLVVGFLSGSDISVSGPAAGLAVIVATAIQNLGSFRVFLLAVAISGLIQILISFLRAGVFGNYVPNSVIKGMLAAIGVVIILKQIPHALGRDADYEGDFDFFQTLAGTSNTLLDILNAVVSANMVAVTITIVSLLILLVWERPALQRYKFFKLTPASLLVVIVGVLLNEACRLSFSDLHLKAEDGHLVMIPVAASLADFFAQFTFPDWTAWNNKQVYITAATIAIIGSIESLLSVEAADKLDPFRRISDTNRELRAQGVGNFISGLIGGLPITSVIVRSSANAYAGSRTRMSAIAHSGFLLVSVIVMPAYLNRIPLACLAAILLLVGYKLTRIGLYQAMYRAGLDQFLPFIITVAAIVFTDLLTGVVVGLVVGFFFVIRTNHHASITVVNQNNYYMIRFNKDLSFINKNELKEHLMNIPDDSKLIIDGTKAIFIDSDIYDVIVDFQQNAKFRNIEVEMKHFYSKAQNYRRRGGNDGKLQKVIAG